MAVLEGGYFFHGSHLLQQALSPAAVAANTTVEQIVTLATPLPVPGGLLQFALLDVNKPAAQAGLGIVGARVVSATQIAITFSNNTAAPITPTAGETYTFVVMW